MASRRAPRMRLRPAFSLQNFRPAVDSKGYITVNASQILGHLDFSLGLVGIYAHDVLEPDAARATASTSSNYLTPQLQFGASASSSGSSSACRCRCTSCSASRSPEFKSTAIPTTTTTSTSRGQFVGDIGFHVKGALPQHVEVSGRPRRCCSSLYVPSGDAKKFLGEGQVTLRPEIIVDKEFGYSRRFQHGAQRRRAHPPVEALVHRRRHDADRRRRRQRRQRLLPAVADAGRWSPVPGDVLRHAADALARLADHLRPRHRRARSCRRSSTRRRALGYADVDRRSRG